MIQGELSVLSAPSPLPRHQEGDLWLSKEYF